MKKKFVQINEQAVRLARQAIDEAGQSDSVHVAGCISPLRLKIEPLRALGTGEAESFFEQQASILAGAGADLIMLETFVDVAELKAGIRGARKGCVLP